MIEKGLIIALIVLSIHYALQPGEIFGKIGDWLDRNLPSFLHAPIFSCNICQSPWYGTIIYWLIWGVWLHTGNLYDGLVCVTIAMGFNILFNKLNKE